MTTFDLTFESRPAENRVSVFAGLKRAWATYRQRRRQAAAMLELSQMDEHLLYDIGLEPADVYEALSDRQRATLQNRSAATGMRFARWQGQGEGPGAKKLPAFGSGRGSSAAAPPGTCR